MVTRKQNLKNVSATDAEDAIDIEEELLTKQDKKMKKHYLKPTAKAFINKFIRSFRS